MNNIKRVLSVMLVVMLMSISFAVPVFATENSNDPSVQPTNPQQDDQQIEQQQEEQQGQGEEEFICKFTVTLIMPDEEKQVLNYKLKDGETKYVSIEEMLNEKGLEWKGNYSAVMYGERTGCKISDNKFNIRYVYAGEKGKMLFMMFYVA